MYANLQVNVVHVLGSKRSAIYDLRWRRIFSIDADLTPTLQRLFSGERIASLGPSSQLEDDLRELQALDLITLDTVPINRNYSLATQEISPQLRIAWIELSTDCNHLCRHCYNHSAPRRNEHDVDVQRIEHNLEELHRLGVHTVKFIGGEPLVHGEQLKRLLRAAKALRFPDIAIHTNATLIDDEWASFFAALGVASDVTIYAHVPEIHDAVTMTSGSFDATIAGVDRLIRASCQVTLNLVVVPQNEEYVPAICAAMHTRFPGIPFNYDYMRPTGRGLPMYKQLQFTYLNRYTEHAGYFSGIDVQEYLIRRTYNPCLHDKIAISPSGEIMNCTMMRMPSGDSSSTSLLSLIGTGHFKVIREITLDKVEICRDCEYRYSCSDCRPLAVGASDGLLARVPECHYNPYRGEMEEEKSVRPNCRENQSIFTIV